MYERILRHLKDYGSITSLDAIREYGCTRLSHYIWLMRNNGYEIESEYLKGTNRYGERTHYVKYKLITSEVKEDGGE